MVHNYTEKMITKKRILPFTILLLFIFSWFHTSLQADAAIQPTEVTNKKESTKPAFGKLTSRIILGIFALELCYLTASQASQEKLSEQFQLKNLLKHCTFEYVSHFLATAMHEFGHAWAANYLNDNKINIHLGGNSPGQDNVLISTDNIAIHGFDPLAGYTLYSKPLKRDGTLNKQYHAIILLAGALTGILSNALFKTSINLISQDNTATQESLLTDPITIMQLFNILVPFTVETTGSSDATKLYTECLNVPKETIAQWNTLGLPLTFLIEFCLVEHHSTLTGTSVFHSKILLAITNLFLRGLARFHL